MKEFEKLPIVGILRGIDEEHLEKISETIIASGLKTVEITMNTAKADILIKKMIEYTSGHLNVGAGTVLTINDLDKALNAGASFIVTPSVTTDVVTYCKSNNIPVFPGALTPTEIYNAWNLGATMVKVFPASLFGPKYIKELKGPFNTIELMAVGGISKDNIGSYFNMGASAVAFGASIFNKEHMEVGRFDIIEQEIKNLIESYHSFKNI